MVVVVVVCFAALVVFPWWCVLVHQRCACLGVQHRWEAAQRVSLSLTAPRLQATPTGTERRSPYTLAPPTPTRSCIHLDVVSFWIQSLHNYNTHFNYFFKIYIFDTISQYRLFRLKMQCCSVWWPQQPFCLQLGPFLPTPLRSVRGWRTGAQPPTSPTYRTLTRTTSPPHWWEFCRHCDPKRREEKRAVLFLFNAT